MFKILLTLLVMALPALAMATPSSKVSTLFDGATANSNSVTYVFNVNTGLAQLVAKGTYDGATVTLQYSDDRGITWVDFDGVAPCTADCSKKIWESFGMQVRAVISGAGGSTDLTVQLYKLEG
jgi:hypothetical protein